jgi:hypothetical protein
MAKKYFEIPIRTKNMHGINEKFLECMLGEENLQIQKNMNFFHNSILLSVFKENNHLLVEENKLENIINVLKKVKKEDVIISCDITYNEYVKILFNSTGVVLKNINNILYYNNLFAGNYLKLFFQQFNIKIIKSNYNLEYYLNLKRLNFPEVDFHKDVNYLIHNIYNSNSNNFYESKNRTDLENLLNLEKGNLLTYYYFQETLESKYILITSLLKVNKEYNLPTNYIRKMVKNLELDNKIETFNYYYYNLICKTQKIEDFKFNSFDDLEEAISHSIDLEKLKIRGILIEKDDKYNICYRNNEKINFTDNVSNNKYNIKRILKDLIGEDYILKNYSLDQLVNIQVYDNKPFLGTENDIPIEIFLNREINIYNLTGSLLDFENKNYPYFDRKGLEINKNFNIELMEKLNNFYNILVSCENENIMFSRDYYIFPEYLENFKKGLLGLLRKGYLFSDTGIVNYITEGKISCKNIIEPEWFSSESEEEFKKLQIFFRQII